MYHTISGPELLDRIRALEHEVASAIEEKQKKFHYRIVQGRARFEKEVEREHARLKEWLPTYVAHSRPMVALSAAVVYACALPMLLADAFLSAYQAICFPVYGIPKVRRSDYFIFDRGRLKYLNLLERLNCLYCSYANGLFAYLAEIAGRTEQHWCPVKHAERLRAPHSRYAKFFEYGDAGEYRRRLEDLRHDYRDLTAPPDSAR